MQDIRLIATDMDGTLLNSEVEISPRTAEVIKAAQKKGVLFSVCTGRFSQFGAMKTNAVGISCPIIGANGGSIWDDDKKLIISSHPIKTEAAMQVNDLLREYGVYYYVFAADTITTSEEGKNHPTSYWLDGALSKKYGLAFGGGVRYTDDVVCNERAVKFFVTKQPDDIVRRLDADLRKINGIYVTTSGKNSFEIMAENVNKCNGIIELAAMHGIDIKNVMAVGDYFNDMPMIRAAGLGVAMGNALDEVKQCADYVTDTNDEDGVAKAIEKFVL